MLCAVVPVSAAAHEPLTENTLTIGAGEGLAPASIAEMSWLAGHWRGEGFGGIAEEIWSPPEGGAMVGMFRLSHEGRTELYEIITLIEHRGGLVMRLKHFNADLTGWEEKAEVVEFPLIAKSDGMFWFDGLTVRPEADGSLTMFLAFRENNGSAREEVLRYRRVGK